jgi:glycosyltransferase involved in cell wall biosynthesis
MVSARRIARKNRVRIIHGRAHVGTAIACLAAFLTRRKVLFDIRGFNPEEYVDSGHWPAGGLKFRLLKFSERVMVRFVSGFVILTQMGREHFFSDVTHESVDGESLYYLPDGRPIQVIPCCVDLQRFQLNAKDALIKDQLKSEMQLGHTERIVAHVGALGGLYPVDRILSVFTELYRDNPKTGFLILCQNNTSLIRNQYVERGLPLANLWIGKVLPEEVPRYLSMADWGLSLKRSGYSQFSCSPTKIPEYLLAGLPVLASQGIGDTDHLLIKNQVGVIFDAFDEGSIRASIEQMNALSEDSGLQARCMETAVREFDLNTIGGPRYAIVYAEMTRQ